MLYRLSYGIKITAHIISHRRLTNIYEDFQSFKIKAFLRGRLWSDPAGTRTQDPNIKSVMLYRLSYGIITLYCQKRLTVSVKVVQI
jgi:hypothetical protein